MRTGRRSSSATANRAVRVYDAGSMELLRVITPPRPRFYGLVRMTPDGAVTVVTSSRVKGALKGGALSAYDTETGRPRFAEIPIDYDPGDVAVSPDGRLVAVSGGTRGQTSIFDLTTGALVSTVGSAPPVDGPYEVTTAALAFLAPDRLAVGSAIGLIRVVDPTTGTVVRSIAGAKGFAESLIAPTPDGRSLVTNGSAGTAVIDRANGAARWTNAGRVNCNRVAPDFRLGIVLCADPFGRVRSLDLVTGLEVPRRFDFQRGFISSVAVSGDGRTLALAGGSTGTVGIWRLDGSGPLQHKIGSGIDAVVGYDPSGRGLLLTTWDGSAQTFRVVDPASGRTIDPLEGVIGASWLGVRNQLGAVYGDGTAARYDVVAHRRLSSTVTLPFESTTLVRDPARRRMLLLDGQGHVQTVRFDGKLVEPKLTLPGGDRSLTSADITPDGRHLLVASEQQGIETYDLARGTRVAAREDLFNVAVSSRGMAAATGADGTIGLYDARTLRRLAPLPAGAGPAVYVQFSADGRRLAVEGWDGLLRTFDVGTRTVLGDPIPVANRDGFVRTAQLPMRADGKQLAVELEDGIVTWDIGTQQIARAACTIAGRNLTRTEWKQYLTGLGEYHRTCPPKA